MRSLLAYSLLVLGLVACVSLATAADTKKLSFVKNNKTYVMLSMSAKFTITEDSKTKDLKYQSSDSAATGNISTYAVEGGISTVINFIVKWNTSEDYQFILTFSSNADKWTWDNSTFVVSEDSKYTIIPLGKMISSFGESKIDVERNDSYICVSPLDYTSRTNSDISVVVVWSQFQLEVMPLNNTEFGHSANRCPVDIDDKIVPIAVGGALGLLLLLVVIIYIISYIRDRRQQSKELRSGYNRIDQPEPNHHS